MEYDKWPTERAWPNIDMEVRSVGGGLEFRGYAAVFNQWSEDLGGFREVIAPGAFTRSLNGAKNGGRDIKMFLNHDQRVVLGSTRAKTLRLSEDERGLLAEATLPDNEWGRPVRDAVVRGDVSSMSFGFAIDKPGVHDSWTPDHKERTLRDIRLFEVSPVTGWPAYPSTDASVRALVDSIDWEDEASAKEVLDALNEGQRAMFLRLLKAQETPTPSPDLAELYARLDRKRPQ